MSERISFEDYLEQNGSLTYANTGTSMEPMLRQNRDLFTVVRKDEKRCKAGDVVLFRHRGNYVLHRIIRVNEKDYTCLGDNAVNPETGVKDSDILGVLVSFVHDGKEYHVSDPAYRRYTAWIMRTAGVRVFARKTMMKLRRWYSGNERKPAVSERTVQDMIYLVRCAVNRTKPDRQRCAGMDLQQVYRTAERHMLTAACGMALADAGIRDDAFVQAEAKAVRRSILLDRELAMISARFEQSGIWYMPLKGAVMKTYYPRIGMRQMSDYDLLVDQSCSQEVRGIMEDLGYITESYGKEHHDLYVKDKVLVMEMHRSLFDYSEDMPVLTYYKDTEKRLVREDGYRYRFTPEDFYIYMLAHEYRHYAGAGTGLRSNLDIYVYLKKFAETLDWAYIGHELAVLKLSDFERDSRELALALFGEGEMSVRAEAVLQRHVASGTYGSETNRVSEGIRKTGSKGEYIRRRLFVSEAEIEASYPFFWKHAYLRPFLPAYRILRGILFRRKRVTAELRALRKHKNTDV